jgi:signal transduction histidine kinase
MWPGRVRRFWLLAGALERVETGMEETIERVKRLLPVLTDENTTNPGSLINLLGYGTALAGYIFTILATRSLTAPLFLAFTAANVLWFACFAILTSYESDRMEYLAHLLLLGLAVTTIWADALIFAGLALDWLLPIVTIVVFLLVYPTRAAIIASVAIAVITMLLVMIASITHGVSSSQILQDQITLLPAFLYAFTFPFFMRQQQQQRRRAEELVAQLEEAQTQLRAHADQVEELAISRERNRMAREIHDTLGHYLTILAVQLETALKLEEHGDPRLHDELVEARRAAAECLAEVRQSVSALRPTDLSRATLTEALARLVREFAAALPVTEIVLDAEGEVDTLAPEIRVTLYRCVQEALTNIRKHAHATKALVRLRVANNRAELTILDNGRGDMNGVQESPSGFGLQGIRERIALVGGSVTAGAEPGGGWRVEATLPLAVPEQEPGGPGATDSLLSARVNP